MAKCEQSNFPLLDEILHQCINSGVSALIGVPPLAMKMVHVFQRNPTIRRMILIGGAEDGFVSFEDMLKDSGDLFNENIDVIKQITSICSLY
jgi:4-coumarate--CoA ligase